MFIRTASSDRSLVTHKLRRQLVRAYNTVFPGEDSVARKKSNGFELIKKLLARTIVSLFVCRSRSLVSSTCDLERYAGESTLEEKPFLVSNSHSKRPRDQFHAKCGSMTA